jgi:hypothetical protein
MQWAPHQRNHDFGVNLQCKMEGRGEYCLVLISWNKLKAPITTYVVLLLALPFVIASLPTIVPVPRYRRIVSPLVRPVAALCLASDPVNLSGFNS